MAGAKALDDVFSSSHHFDHQFIGVGPVTAFLFKGSVSDCDCLCAGRTELETVSIALKVLAFLESEETLNAKVSFVGEFYLLGFFKAGIVRGEAEFNIFGGDVQVHQGDIGCHVDLKDVFLVDDIVERQVDGSQHVGLEPNGELLFRLAIYLHCLSGSALKQIAAPDIPLEQDGTQVIVAHFYLLLNFTFDENSPKMYFAGLEHYSFQFLNFQWADAVQHLLYC